MPRRIALATVLVIVPLLSWAWIVAMARDMNGPMTGSSAWMMATRWDTVHLLLLWAMWAVMMAAMMLPSASPVMMLYAAAARRRGEVAGRPLHVFALATGYVLVWAGFSIAAVVLQRVLSTLLVLSPMMQVTSRPAGGIVLIVAGLYQLTPLKWTCLQTCRSPLSFLMERWREGRAGAFRMGAEHGVYCVGCCWALMLLLFVGGVMNLLVIVALTLFIAVEKLVPFGDYSARISGFPLMALGVWLLMM
jgi:predicted metal-binding membrane protein